MRYKLFKIRLYYWLVPFKRCTGLTKYVFDLMVVVMKDYNKKYKEKDDHPSKLIIENQILMLLEYYRECRTFFHLGLSCGLDESNVHRTIIKLENSLIKSGYFRLEGKKVLTNPQKVKDILYRCNRNSCSKTQKSPK